VAIPYRLRLITAFVLGAPLLLVGPPVQAGGTLTVSMTAGDLPITTGNPDQGFEGYRFVGYNLYDSLALWDLSQGDKASDIKPGLATEWHVDEANDKRWIFTQRQGVRWHDGCPFTAGRRAVEHELLQQRQSARIQSCPICPGARLSRHLCRRRKG
jgi:ABC-type transport system substrate-binding protein